LIKRLWWSFSSENALLLEHPSEYVPAPDVPAAFDVTVLPVSQHVGHVALVLTCDGATITRHRLFEE
jgi:hypothetical protein